MNVKPETKDAKPIDDLPIAIFQVPNKFFEANGQVTDAGGEDWDSAWGHVLST